MKFYLWLLKLLMRVNLYVSARALQKAGWISEGNHRWSRIHAEGDDVYRSTYMMGDAIRMMMEGK